MEYAADKFIQINVKLRERGREQIYTGRAAPAQHGGYNIAAENEVDGTTSKGTQLQVLCIIDFRRAFWSHQCAG